jgi:5-methylcytosine-specific restriction endonuclease McrA
MRTQQRVKLRDGFACRLCGDWKDKIYPLTGAVVIDIHAHHIIPKSQDGPNTMENLITLCDLCHGVVTPNWWRWFGIDKIENGEEKMGKLKQTFDDYLDSVRCN